MDPETHFSAEDIASMNDASVARAAAFLRRAGAVLIAVGIVGAAAWLYLEVRTQQRVSGESFSVSFNVNTASGTAPDFGDRFDVFVGALSLLFEASIVAGFGFVCRLMADYVVTRTGGTVTGFVVGDPIPVDDDSDAVS